MHDNDIKAIERMKEKIGEEKYNELLNQAFDKTNKKLAQLAEELGSQEAAIKKMLEDANEESNE